MSAHIPTNAQNAALILQEANDKTFRAAVQSELASGQATLGAKEQGVESAIKSAKGELMDATSKFVASGAGVLTNMSLASKGASAKSIGQQKDEADAAYRARTGREGAVRQVYSTLAQTGSAGQAIDKAADALSQSVGGAHMKAQAGIEQKVADLSEATAKIQSEGAKGLREQVMKAMDSTNDFVRGAYDRASQAINKAFGS